MKDITSIPRQLEVILREPSISQPPQHVEILFVHGSCHTALCWQQFQEYFADTGYRSQALSLRGHGKSEGRATVLSNRLRDYVADVEQVVRNDVKGPFIFVGHSFGGSILQSYLYQRELPRPAGCILLGSTTAEQARKLSRDLSTILKNVGPFLRVLRTGNTYAMYTTPEQTRCWFFTSDTPQEIVDTCFRQLQDESFRAATDILRMPSPEKDVILPLGFPLYLLGAERDALISPSAIKASAVAWNAEYTIFPGRGHDIMLDSGWQEVAEHIVQWIKSTSRVE